METKSVELDLCLSKSEEEILDELEEKNDEYKKEVEDKIEEKEKIADDILEEDVNSLKLLNGKLKLDEAPIPSDLVKAYKKSRYRGEPGADLHNATYTEISPDEAYSLIKKDNRSEDIRVLINGRLVKLQPSGHGESDPRFRTDVPWDKAYVNKNGKSIRDVHYMSPKYLLSIADKIYVTNEATPEGQKDPNLLAQRASNKASKDDLRKSEIATDSHRRGLDYSEWRVKMNKEERERLLKDYSIEKKKLVDKLESGEISQEEFESSLNKLRATRDRDLRWNQASNKKKDYDARQRYADSEISLTKNRVKYKDLKKQIGYEKSDLNDINAELNDVMANGTWQTRQLRSKIKARKDTIREYLMELSVLESALEDADDSIEVAKLQKNANDISSRVDNLQDEINKLLKKTESLDNTKELMSLVESNNLTEDFDDILDTLYSNKPIDSIVEELESNCDMIKEMLNLGDE